MDKINELISEIYSQNIENYIQWLKNDKFNIIIVCIDVLLVIYLIKKAYDIIKDTHAIQLAKGLLILVFITIISKWLNLYILNYIMQSIMTYGVLLFMIVFQPEIRRTVEKIGNKGVGKIFKMGTPYTLNDEIIESILLACKHLSSKNIGALIIIEGETKLADYMQTGIKIESNLSKELIINLFEPNTPLHDGAIIVDGNKIKAAACILPLTKRTDLKSEFGTRHRAGIGISEVSDCISIIVSEETGKISLSMDGKISTNLSMDQLERFLKRELKKELNEMEQ